MADQLEYPGDDMDPIAQEALIRELDEEPPEQLLGAAKSSYRVKVLNNGGKAVLDWKTNSIGRWDWVGLYDGPGGSWNDYKAGQWNWVRRARHGAYQTKTNYSPKLQARYVIWDYGMRAYTVVASSE